MKFRINNKHEHDYNQLSYLKDRGSVKDRYIDRVILTRICSCGDSLAFECGPKDEMRELYKELIHLSRSPNIVHID